MRILRVKLTNLNSLRGPHEINFDREPLASAGLFAITGPTGAGKSTLLDAITLALYGKAARYGSSPSPDDMMSRHSGECLAEVEFQVPLGTFRAEWQLHRARSKPDGKVQAPKRFVYDSSGNVLAQNVRESEILIEKLIGLDYPRFLRSALLAQGEFAQFLKARPDERAELLESLTGTAIYSALGTLAHTEAGRRETDMQSKQAAIALIQLLSDEQREKLQRDIPAAESQFRQAKQDLERLNALLNKAAALAAAIQQQKNALNRKQGIIAEQEAATPQLQLLARHSLTIPFAEDLARLEAASKAASSAKGLLEEAITDHSGACLTATRYLRAFRQFVTQKIEDGRSETEALRGEHQAALDRKTDATKWLSQHKSDKRLPQQITELATGLTELKGARRDLNSEWTRLRTLAGKLDKNEAEALASDAGSITGPKAKSLLSRLTRLAKTKMSTAKSDETEAKKELRLREDDLAKARLIANFEDHRAGLKPGQPCPLCGATKHPFAEGAEPSFPFKDLEHSVREADQSSRRAEKRIDDLSQALEDLGERRRGLSAAIAQHSRLTARLKTQLRTLGAPVPAAGAEDSLRTTLQQRATTYRTWTATAERAEKDRALTDADRRNRERALTSLLAKDKTLSNESVPTPAQVADRLQTEPPPPRWRTVEEAEKAWNDSKNVLASKRASLDNRQSDYTNRQKEQAACVSNLSAKLRGSAFKDTDALKAARLDQARVTRLEDLQNSLTARATKATADLQAANESVEKWRAEKAPEDEAVPGLKSSQATTQARHDQLISELTTARNQLAQDNTNRAAIAVQQKALESARQQLVIWQRLRGLIGSHDGRTFRRYAQGISLDILVLYANRHLLRLSDRYRLRRRRDEELDLEIEDLYQAGAVRPMASLSGGESFLASLALALGLSDIAGRNVRIESLFVDEGFGSLDSETLDVAISALETLRQDSKTVGIISHVDLLKERIATQIVVEKQSGGTSLLRIEA